MKVTTKEINITYLSFTPNTGEYLPTFQKARLKTVKWFFFTVAKYIIYSYKEHPEYFDYKRNWKKL